MNNLIKVKALFKEYDDGLISAVGGVNLELSHGKIYALMGPSGCGKSTLLNLIGTLDKPSSGLILYEGRRIDEVDSLHSFRRDFIGFVFQFHHLIPVLTIRENVESALLSDRSISSFDRTRRALKILKKMSMLHRADAYASKISGGERQRGAIARALINKPKMLLADEPTGNVDSKTAGLILTTMQNHVQKYNSTMLIATHDHNVAEIADVLIQMEDGKIVSIKEKRR